MTLAFFSDVHANLPALQAVLADLDRRQPDMIFCLGDLVGYAPWPNEVVQEIRRRGIATIAGNYDYGVGRHSDDCGCAYKTDADQARGARSIAYTNVTVGEAERRYLRQLPRHLRLEFELDTGPLRLLLVHGSPRRINEYLFEDRPEASFRRLLTEAAADVLLCGHTHKPFHRVLPPTEAPQSHYGHVLNLGSVGKPKDGDPRAAYLLVHLDEATTLTTPDGLRTELVRVPYDVEQAAQAIEASTLPNEFADMLRRAY